MRPLTPECATLLAVQGPLSHTPVSRKQMTLTTLHNTIIIYVDAASGAAVAGAATVYLYGKSTEAAAAAVDTAKEAKEELQQLVNWSGTHHVRPKRFYQPETTEEVEDIVRKSHEQSRHAYHPLGPMSKTQI